MPPDEDWAHPPLEIVVVDDETERAPLGFLAMRRLRLQNVYEDGEKSRVYAYDVVERRALDAVVVLLVTRDEPARVCVRSAIRPPLAFRSTASLPMPETLTSPILWEIPAGLVESEERGEEGLRACAARETLEETGFVVAPDDFAFLGRSVFLSPGVLGERVHFLTAFVDPAHRGIPTEDGSPTEERARLRFVTLRDAIAACDDGHIEDAKTEVALRRLAARNPT